MNEEMNNNVEVNNQEMTNNNVVVNDTISDNNYEPPKSNNGVKVLLVVLIVLVLCLIGLLSYKLFVVDKKNDNKKDNNKQNNSKLDYKLVEDSESTASYLYVNNKEVLKGWNIEVEEFNDNTILVIGSPNVNSGNKLYAISSKGEINDLSAITLNYINYYHSYTTDKNSITIIAAPGNDNSKFIDGYCSLFPSDDYYPNSNIGMESLLNSTIYKIKYDYKNGKFVNKTVIEEKKTKEDFSNDKCKSKLTFINYLEGYICVNYNEETICFNNLNENKEKLEKIFGKENCKTKDGNYICIVNDPFDYNDNGMEADLNLNTNIVTDYTYKGYHCYDKKFCQQES